MSTTTKSGKAYSESVRERIQRQVQEQRGAKTPIAQAMETALEQDSTPKPDPFFLEPYAETDGADMVRLSSLVPSWDFTRGTMDPLVQVFNMYAHSENAQAFVPPVTPGYRPNQQALAMLAYAIEDTDLPAWLSGDPSVGKSSLVQYFCAITGRPFRRVNFNGQIGTDSILGKQSVVSTEHGPATVWHDGIVPEAMQIPHCILLLDEPTSGPAEVQLSLQYALERGGKLLLLDKPCASSEAFVVPATGMRMVLADNTTGMGDSTGRFIGTQPQNTAWLDRMGSFIEVTWLSEDDEAAMLRSLYPLITDKLATSIVRVAGLLRRGVKHGDLTVAMSMRVTQAWAMHACNLRDVQAAFDVAYLNRIDSDSEREAVREIYRSIFG